MARRNRQARPRLPALPAARRLSPEWRRSEPEWFNAPVASFGPIDARLLIVGLAPGLRGANRTGRPFTGDYAGDLLYATLKRIRLRPRRITRPAPTTASNLIDCRITNAVRCVPPENKPTPQEITTCRDFLTATIGEMPKLRAVVALGRVAHETFIAARNAQAPRLSVRARPHARDRRDQLVR